MLARSGQLFTKCLDYLRVISCNYYINAKLCVTYLQARMQLATIDLQQLGVCANASCYHLSQVVVYGSVPSLARLHCELASKTLFLTLIFIWQSRIFQTVPSQMTTTQSEHKIIQEKMNKTATKFQLLLLLQYQIGPIY